MEKRLRFIVEKSHSQRARQQKTLPDGVVEVYVSRRHKDVFMFVAGSVIDLRGVPTYDEIAEMCGYKNRDSALRAVWKLADYGLLRTSVRRARSIEVTPAGETIYRQWKKRKARAEA